jgi:hypothetical protein
MRLSVERITMLDKTQKAAALLLASYSTPEEISRRLQIPPENLQEYQKDPEFSEAVASARSQAENTAEKSVQREALYAFGATAAELA